MPSYRRFVTYLFHYENQVKIRNCGFAKVEIRQGQCRLELQVKGIPDGTDRVYLFTGQKSDIYGLYIGKLQIRNRAGTNIFVFSADSVGDTPWGIDDMKGIYLEEEDGDFAASQWEDEELDWESFRVYQNEQEESVPAEKTDDSSQNDSRQDNGLPQEAENTMSEAESDPIMRGPEEGGSEEKRSEKEPEIHATQAPAAARESMPSGESPVSSYMNTWEKKWKRFSAAHPVFCPFDEAQDIFAVKMDLRDFKILPRQYLPLANNSFLLHGYFNYKYLLFGYAEGESRKWFLGVPGVFQNQEQLLAGLFGFGEFRTKHVTKQKTGEFGYWYRYLDL